MKWSGPPYLRSMRREHATRLTGTESRYRDNLPRHLIAISRDLQARVSQALGQELGYQGLRPSFGPFLSLLWDEGRPLTAVADELAISKQACGQLANAVADAGYLARRSNPSDRRSKLVGLTARGRRLVEDGVRIILESESDYRALVGANAYPRFTAALAELYRGLGIPTHADPGLTARAGQSVGVLPLVAVRIQRELMHATIARGHPGLKMSHGQVLPLIGSGGGRIHEIARIQGVSRQAISAISQELEALGYLQRGPDPKDRRGVVLRRTRRGDALIRDSVHALDDLEHSFHDMLGARQLAQLQRVARDLYHGLHVEAEIFGSLPSVASGSPAARRRDIQQLATRLQRRLGSGDAARLGALLEPRTRRAST
jgi:DNA-binding MarR family transcriptional regulator